MKGWDPSTLHASLQAFFLMASVTTLIGHAAAGLWTGRMFLLLGRWVNERIDPSRFKRLIYVVLLVLGAPLSMA